jgi:heme A synthase
VAVKVFSQRRQFAVLTGTGLFVLLGVQVQVFLGILAFLVGGRPIGGLLETAHQVVGPLLFAGSSLLVLRAFRNLELSTEPGTPPSTV